MHAARKDKRHYVVRVLSAGGEGLGTLNIMRLLTRSPDNLLSNNHMLLMEEILYQDIVFGVFPLLGDSLQYAMMPLLQESSIEDIVLMIMQALEVGHFYYFSGFCHLTFSAIYYWSSATNITKGIHLRSNSVKDAYWLLDNFV